ncbi:hypothetical protein IE53DRAFT_391239, partial [Violaceomyces palustris]
ACVACHKAKRRCDGGLPCSNCDFSGRTCCYSDPTGKMVLPTARAGIDANIAAQQLQQQQQGSPQASQDSAASAAQPVQIHFINSRLGDATQAGIELTQAIKPNGHTRNKSSNSSQPSPPPFQSPKIGLPTPPADPQWSSSATSQANLDLSPERRRELISIFFQQVHPFSSAIDEISFLRDLSTSDVSQHLLLSMYALSARFQQGVHDQERFMAGEPYAKAARSILMGEDEHGNIAIDRPDLDTAQALCFLAAHELGMGRFQRALYYSNACVRAVSSLKLHEGFVPQRQQPSYSRESNASSTIRKNTCQKFACLAWCLDILVSTLAGQTPLVRAEDVELALSRFSGTGDETAKSFCNLARVFAVFARVLDHSRKVKAAVSTSSSSSSSRLPKVAELQDEVRRCEESLFEWAESLPLDQRFDETNLESASKVLSDVEAQPATDRAWCWSMMHSMAECSMFLLHSQSSPNATTPSDLSLQLSDPSRPQAAYANLLLVLDSFGNGRRSPFVLLPLLICTEFPVRPTLNVSRWWNHSRECWNLSEEQINDAANHVNAHSSRSSSSSNPSPPPPSLPLPRPSSNAAAAAPPPPLPRHHHSASGSFLPSLASLPLPALRLSPPSGSNSISLSPSHTQSIPMRESSSMGGGVGDVKERTSLSLSPIGHRLSPPTSLGGGGGPNWSPSSPANEANSPNNETASTSTSPKSPGDRHFELFNAPAAGASGIFKSNTPLSRDPRSNWSPIASLKEGRRNFA